MKIGRDLRYLVRFFLFRVFVLPVRELIWKNKRSFFLHTSTGNPKFYLYPGELIDRKIYLHGIFDRRFLEFISNNFHDSRTMIDIGANIGNHSIFCSRLFEAVHAFEPNPIALDRLRKNIEVNNINNITVHPYGAGYEEGEYPFFVNNSGNLGASHTVKKEEVKALKWARESEKILSINVVNLDNYLSEKRIEKIDFVKIDVEGFELDVIKGLEETIKKYKPIISFEYHGGNFDSEYFSNFSMILRGYSFFELVFENRKDTWLKKIKLFYMYSGNPTLMPITTIEARTYKNIISIPREAKIIPAS